MEKNKRNKVKAYFVGSGNITQKIKIENIILELLDNYYAAILQEEKIYSIM